jgi:2-methylaconitate cis-trans-isomerase PrpF
MSRPEPIPAVLMRGGTSKGVFLHADDLPPQGSERDDLLLRIMGTPDPMQIDGLGGTYSSTSKVVVVERDGPASVSYWFAQVGVDDAVVDWAGNCGNLTSAVGPFAIDEGLVEGIEPLTRLLLRNRNTGVDVEVEVLVEGGRAAVEGELAIAGVPGTGSPVVTRYVEPSGGVLGAMLPTGSPTDVLAVDGRDVVVSIVDVAHPYVFVEAAQLGLAADDTRTPAELNADAVLLSLVEAVRAAAAVRVGVATDAADATRNHRIVPRIVLLHPSADADVRVTAFSMGVVHRAVPMTAALCLAASIHVLGTVGSRLATGVGDVVRIAHAKGIATVEVETRPGADPIRSVGVVRTARRLMEGRVYPRPA